MSRTCRLEWLRPAAGTRLGDAAGVCVPFRFFLLPSRLLDGAAELQIHVTDFLHAPYLRGAPTVCQRVSPTRESTSGPQRGDQLTLVARDFVLLPRAVSPRRQ